MEVIDFCFHIQYESVDSPEDPLFPVVVEELSFLPPCHGMTSTLFNLHAERHSFSSLFNYIIYNEDKCLTCVGVHKENVLKFK